MTASVESWVPGFKDIPAEGTRKEARSGVGRMTLEDLFCRPPYLGPALPFEDPLLCPSITLFGVNNGERVMDTGLETRFELEERGHQVGFGQITHGNP